jgi:hypothetical protein
MPRGRERFRQLGYDSAPLLARIALAEATCCGTHKKTQAGAATPDNTAADRIGRLARASRRAA